MKTQIVNSKEQLTTGVITNTEESIGAPLPSEYRSFLLRNNGGRPKPPGFSFTRHGRVEPGMVGDFYAIHDGAAVNLLKTLQTFRSRIPPGFLPIADDPGGNQLLIGLGGDHQGKVYYWIHDMDDEIEDETDVRNLGLIENSFQEFLNSLDEIRE